MPRKRGEVDAMFVPRPLLLSFSEAPSPEPFYPPTAPPPGLPTIRLHPLPFLLLP